MAKRFLKLLKDRIDEGLWPMVAILLGGYAVDYIKRFIAFLTKAVKSTNLYLKSSTGSFRILSNINSGHSSLHRSQYIGYRLLFYILGANFGYASGSLAFLHRIISCIDPHFLQCCCIARKYNVNN